MANPELPVPDGLVLRPFRGVRFTVDDPAKVTSPPYDLISDSDVRDLLATHPNNVVRLILPCTPQNPPSPRPPASSAQHSHGPQQPQPTSSAHHQQTGQWPHEPDQTPLQRPSSSGHEAEQSEASGHVRPPHAPRQRELPQHEPLPAHHWDDAAERSPQALHSQPPHARDAAVAAERYGEARDTLRDWLASGILAPDETPALYVYEQSGPGVLQRGLIGDVCLAAPEQGIVLPHEDVMPGPVADRLALMSTTQANFEPIFLLYDGSAGHATRLVDEVATHRTALMDVHAANGVRHRLWAITDPSEIDAINADLHPRQALIADGHHRYATYRELQRQERTHPRPDARPAKRPEQPDVHAITGPERADIHATGPERADVRPTTGPERADVHAATGPERADAGAVMGSAVGARGLRQPWDFGLALLVDSSAYPPDLQAIHRVIPSLSIAEATARAKGSWQVHDFGDLDSGLAALDAAEGPAYLLTDGTTGYLLTDPDPMQLAHAMPETRSDRWNSLNTSVLTEFVMPKVWGMRDDEQAVRIVHHDAHAAARLAAQTGGTAVILKPLAVTDVLAVAAGGERVPRKSTSFGPKPLTGLVLRTFAID